MKKIVSRIVTVALVTFALPVFAGGGYSLEVKEQEAPAEISAEIRELLGASAIVVSNEGGPMFEFWFAKEVKASAIGEDAATTMGNIEPMAMLGAVMVHGEVDAELTDFREDPIDPGVYTFRLAVQPQDGNHMGTAPANSAFGVLIPHERDEELSHFQSHDDMIDVASEDTVAAHPPILNMQAVKAPEGDFPRLGENADHDWELLLVKLNVTAGGESAEVPVQLVFEGVGEL